MNQFAPLFEQLKRRRAALGLSQADVASRAGIEQSQVSKLERGLDVRLSTLMKLLTALELGLDVAPRVRGILETQPTPLALRVAGGTLLDRYGIADGDEPKDHPAPTASRKKR